MVAHPQSSPEKPRIWVSKKITQRGPASFRVQFQINGISNCRLASSLAEAKEVQQLLQSGVIPVSRRQVIWLSGAELEERRADERYEEHHDIQRVRACRICGKCYANLGPTTAGGHLLTEHDGMTLVEYRDYCQQRGWGMPSTLSPRFLNLTLARVRQRIATKPEEVREERGRATANFKNKYNTDERFRERKRVQMERSQDKTRADRFGDALVQCPYCPRKMRTLRKHIGDVHPEQLEQQQQKPPMIVPELGAQHFERLEKGKSAKLTAAKRRVTELVQQLDEANKEVQQLEAAQQGNDAKIALAVGEMIRQFSPLFCLPEVQANPRLVRQYGWSHPDILPELIPHMRVAVESRKPVKLWPKIAAISFVATRDHYERDYVKVAYNRVHRLQRTS